MNFEIAYHICLGGIGLSFLLLFASMRVFTSIRLAGIASILGVLSATGAVLFGLHVDWVVDLDGIWHPAILIPIFGYLAFLNLRRINDTAEGPGVALERVQSRLAKADVALPLSGFIHPGTCFRCGQENAPLHPRKLARVQAGPNAVGEEWITMPIPLCPEHAEEEYPDPGCLGGLGCAGGLILFFLGFAWMSAISNDPVTQSIFERIPALGIAFLILLIVGGLLAWYLPWRHACRHAIYRLKWMDQALGIVVIRLNDLERAARIREEIPRLAPWTGQKPPDMGSDSFTPIG